MVNHICEPISPNQLASCRSARALQGGGEAPLTVNLEFPYLGQLDLRQAPAGEKLPALVVDSHELAYDLGRQFAGAGGSLGRRLYARANWRKLRSEELGTYRDADGVYLCSAADERRLWSTWHVSNADLAGKAIIFAM
jgi:hypothetical protein